MNEYVQSKVGPPGIALMVLGIVSVLANLGTATVVILTSVTQIIDMVNSGAPVETWIAWFTSSGYQMVMMLIAGVISVLVIVAGARLRSARSPALVYLGSILAMLPCCGVGVPCCCFGLPIGIWALVTMQDEQVKAAFAEG